MRVAWEGDEDWTAEVCELELPADGIVATGTQLGVDPYPYCASYERAANGLVTHHPQISRRVADT